jgi:hypothetical protein
LFQASRDAGILANLRGNDSSFRIIEGVQQISDEVFVGRHGQFPFRFKR